MDFSISDFLSQYWTYLTIPVVSALVGYGTNWLAVRMMMYPVEFKGAGVFGWQGVIPANAKKMADVVVTHCLGKILTQKELFERIKVEELMLALQHRLEPFIEDLVDEIMEESEAYGIKFGNFFWSAAPGWMKGAVYGSVKSNLPGLIEEIIDDIGDHLDDLIDINEVVGRKLSENKELLIQIFLQSGYREFKFIQWSGLYFGFPLGIPVMVLWYFFPEWWVLPAFGLVVGYLTNFAAIYMVEKPLDPVTIGKYKVQGLFVKRQKEVARYYGKVFAEKLLPAEELAAEIFRNERSVELIHQLIHRNVNTAVEQSQGSFKPVAVLSMGPSAYKKIVKVISERAFKEVQHGDKRSFAFMDESLDIEETIADRVGHLPPQEFYELLHPVVAEDEWKLIAVGAVLGCAAGWLQWLLLT